MVLLAFVSALLQILNAGHAVGFSVRVAHGLRTRLNRKIQSMSFGNLNRFQTSDLLVRLTNDVNVFKQMIILVTAFFTMAPLMLTGSVVLTWLTTCAGRKCRPSENCTAWCCTIAPRSPPGAVGRTGPERNRR
jgi:ATP-binding cassette subfamily B protein